MILPKQIDLSPKPYFEAPGWHILFVPSRVTQGQVDVHVTFDKGRKPLRVNSVRFTKESNFRNIWILISVSPRVHYYLTFTPVQLFFHLRSSLIRCTRYRDNSDFSCRHTG